MSSVQPIEDNNVPDPPNRCPMCGYEFVEVRDSNYCPRCRNVSDRDELIGDWADCAWDQ